MEGRGRGLLLDIIEKKKAAAAAAAASTSGSSSSDGGISLPQGRGRAFAALSRTADNRPGSVIAPASDVAPPGVEGRASSAGRGNLLSFIKARTEARGTPDSGVPSTPSDEASTLSSEMTRLSVGKNKNYSEIRNAPPIVKMGTSGQPIDVLCNYIHLHIIPGMGVFEYEVRFSPSIDALATRFKILAGHTDLIGNTKSFDGTTLYLPRQIPDTTLKTKNPHTDDPIEMKILFRRERRMSEMMHIFNVILKNIMRELEMVNFKRQYYDQHKAILVPQHKLQVWPGYVTAVTEREGGLMLTLDVSHKLLHTQTVHQFMREVMHKDMVNYRVALRDVLVGTTVMTTYNNKTYRVDDIDENMTPLSTFESAKGDSIVIRDYYKQNYNIDIVDNKQPLLVSRSSRNVAGSKEKVEIQLRLVPELCVLTGLRDTQRADFRLMKDLAAHTRVTPNQRLASYRSFLESVQNNERARVLLSNWGLKLADNPVQMVGRTIPPQEIIFGNNQTIMPQSAADWNREVGREKMLQTVDLNNWALIFTKKDSNLAREYSDCLRRCGPSMGWRVADPNAIMIEHDTPQAYVEALKRLDEKSCQIVTLLCPSARSDRYAAIKKICCCDKGMPSQVINSRTIMNRDKQRRIVQKIALQVNCKLGGTLWTVKLPLPNAMIVGIDSYHQVSKNHSSVCGFVASYDSLYTRWFSKTTFGQKGQEIVDGLKMCLTEALKFYFQQNGVFPDHVIMYRDGVGDGQLDVVAGYEKVQLEEALNLMTKQAKLTVIVVQKRINTRIFAKLNGLKLDNPPPGTVVDNSVTKRDWYDFFLVSQKVNQGTVTPTHYVVVSDNSNLTTDQIQKLTYKMTHLYFNWPGTVRVPAPCQYAHKLAGLVGEAIQKDAHPRLNDRLFFL